MPKIKQAVEKFFRKGFWLSKKNKKDIETEAEKKFGGNESALVRHIVANWFEK